MVPERKQKRSSKAIREITAHRVSPQEMALVWLSEGLQKKSAGGNSSFCEPRTRTKAPGARSDTETDLAKLSDDPLSRERGSEIANTQRVTKRQHAGLLLLATGSRDC